MVCHIMQDKLSISGVDWLKSRRNCEDEEIQRQTEAVLETMIEVEIATAAAALEITTGLAVMTTTEDAQDHLQVVVMMQGVDLLLVVKGAATEIGRATGVGEVDDADVQHLVQTATAAANL